MAGTEQTGTILVVEDDPGLRELLEEELADAGYRVTAADNVESAAGLLRNRDIDLVISDLRLPGATGLDLLHAATQLRPAPGFIIITAFGTVEQAVDALKLGADDFLTKPLKLDHLRISVSRVLQKRQLQEEVTRYRKLLGNEGFHGLIGNSQEMKRLFETVRMVARVDGPVLVFGENGTGKELVARAIHEESPRRKNSFIAVNCAGIPPDLLESELFGHAAGAFTGAQKARAGLFSEADKGTLLLDEISEMPVEMQVKLLRVLQDGRVRPVGSNHEQQLDLRIIAATNRDLEEEVRQGRFRQDLYFRLETFTINVPPLRDRSDDLDLLTAYFINNFNLRMQRNIRGITADALARLKHHSFPGNVRELSNTIERAVAFCRGREISVTDLPERVRRQGIKINSADREPVLPGLPGKKGPLPTLAEVEKDYIRLVLDRLDGNKRRAAETLGIGRRTLYRHLEGMDETAEKHIK